MDPTKSGRIKYHVACVTLHIALVTLVAVQKRIGINRATQAWTLQWQLAASEDCDRAHNEQQTFAKTYELESALPQGPRWTGGWLIGSGGFAKAYLYVQHDDNGAINNRVVAKDSDHWEDAAWDTKCNWFVKSDGERVPMEVKTMFDLRGRERSEYILKILNWRMSTEKRLLRIYTAFAPLGNLLQLVSRYNEADENIPEPYLWHTFECLAIAGLLMERGEMENNPVSEWTPIVHRDLKLDNVFLDQPSEKRYCQYPTPKIADFGAAVHAPTSPPREKAYYNNAGTTNNFPAEQHPTLNSRVVSSKSNVWGVANIVASLIWKTAGHNDLNYGQRSGGVSEPEFNYDQIASYSLVLLDLIGDCMRYNQDDRPDFPTLLRSIRSAKEAGKHHGLENALFESDKWMADSLMMELEDMVRFAATGDNSIHTDIQADFPGRKSVHQ
jgi:serine/threonine protein kinase